MTTTDTPLVLVDGSSYLYRAFHAMYKADLRNSKGEPTGAIRGVINMLRSLIKTYPESTVAVIFDAKGKTFRDEIYPEYKAHRPPMPDDLRSQIEPVHKIIKAMGLPLIVEEGVEADDVIGTLAREAESKGLPVVISTGDKDMAQLVSTYITLVNTMTETVLDPVGVQAKFGVPPELIIDYLALIGDASDNIPGVPGVGEKSALGMLQGIGGIDALYENLEQIRELDFRGAKKMPEKMAEHKEVAYLSYQLATIKLDVPLKEAAIDIKNNAADKATLLELFEYYEFKSWVEELRLQKESNQKDLEQSEATKKNALIEKTYQTLLTKEEFSSWVERLKLAPVFAFDTETTSLDYMQAQLVGVSFAVEPYEAAYVPLRHDYLGVPEQLDQDWVLNQLKPLLEDKAKPKLGQNLKYDKSVLARHGINLQGIKFDTMLESYVVNAVGGRHDMNSLALKYLNEETIHFEDIAGKGAGQLTFNQIAIEEASPYAAEDADITLRLHDCLWPKVAAEEGLIKVFETIEMPLVPILSRIECTGALVDAGLLRQQSDELGLRINELELEAYRLAGEEFNLASPKQLGHIMYEKMGIPVRKKTAKGAPSTKEEVLQELALDYPLPKLLLEHRGLAKLKSTYTDKLPTMINAETGRIHTSYHQAVTATGRLSSSDPNLQNIPIRSKEGRRIRQAFIAPKGGKIVAADYSQIELRIMAHLSQDKGLLSAFNQGLDVHRATAAEVFSTPLNAVTTEQRRSAKAINFGLIYGMSAFGLGKQLHIGRTQAQEYMDLYFSRYTGVKDYMEATRAKAAEQGYVETLFGRRLYLPDINASNGMRRQAAERIAINAPMQGTAADIIKLAMIAVDQWLTREKLESKVIMQVHDELVLEVPEQELERVTEGLRQQMSDAANLSIPLVVDVGVGLNWDEAH